MHGGLSPKNLDGELSEVSKATKIPAAKQLKF